MSVISLHLIEIVMFIHARLFHLYLHERRLDMFFNTVP